MLLIIMLGLIIVISVVNVKFLSWLLIRLVLWLIYYWWLLVSCNEMFSFFCELIGNYIW